MKGMMKIPQEELDDKESKKESIYQSLKLKSLFNKDKAFLKIAFYFIVAHIIVILILTRNDMLKKSKNNGLSSEDMKKKVRLALYIHSLVRTRVWVRQIFVKIPIYKSSIFRNKKN